MAPIETPDQESDTIVATYVVKVTVRTANPNVIGMPIDALTEVVEDAIVDAYVESGDGPVSVRATAERTDR